MKSLRETYGRFDDNLWSGLLTDPHSRRQLREAMVARYFPEKRPQLAAIAGESSPASKEAALREEPPGRDGAFRITILELYDHIRESARWSSAPGRRPSRAMATW